MYNEFRTANQKTENLMFRAIYSRNSYKSESSEDIQKVRIKQYATVDIQNKRRY